MIDPNLPVRFIGPDGQVFPHHGRVCIVGNDGMGHHRIRYHDGKEWRTSRIDGAGWSVDHQALPTVENYSLDWDRPLAFIDTGDRGWLSHRTEGHDPIVFVTGAGDERYLYNTAGMALKRDGDFEITARDIMNVETNATRQRDAQARLVEKKAALARADAARALDEAHPLWGMF